MKVDSVISPEEKVQKVDLPLSSLLLSHLHPTSPPTKQIHEVREQPNRMGLAFRVPAARVSSYLTQVSRRGFHEKVPSKTLPYSKQRSHAQPQVRDTGSIESNITGRLRERTSRNLDQLWEARWKLMAQTFFWGLNSFLIAHVLWNNVASINGCFGPSMLPTLNVEGDWVVISKLHEKGRGVGVGDLVSYDHPVRQGTHAIKRIVAMPGDFVLRDTPGKGHGDMVQMPPNHCWVAGDNLAWSRDSRHFGPLPMGLIRGKVVGRIFPWGQRCLFTRGLEDFDSSV